MARFLNVVPVDEAVAAAVGLARPVGTETVPLEEASGRVLGADARAETDLPGFRRSTVDGYAVRASETVGASDALPSLFRLKGRVAMGAGASFALGPGECAYVPTGGEVPEGADAVAMVEHAELLGDEVLIGKTGRGRREPGPPGRGLRRRRGRGRGRAEALAPGGGGPRRGRHGPGRGPKAARGRRPLDRERGRAGRGGAGTERGPGRELVPLPGLLRRARLRDAVLRDRPRRARRPPRRPRDGRERVRRGPRLGRLVQGRARPRRQDDRRPRRGAGPRDRARAGQADDHRPGRRRSPPSVCPATRPRPSWSCSWSRGPCLRPSRAT